MKRSQVLDELVDNIELDRILNLPVSEKFKLMEYVKLIYKESEYAAREGFLNLKNSPNYTSNKTYNLFAMLMVNLADYSLVKRIILNYASHFERSDLYYSQITITGMGVLMMEKEFTPEAIYHLLLSLIGEDFLLNNLHSTADEKEITEEEFKLDSTIKYKPFEGKIREIKYNLLALLKLSHEKDVTYVKELINNSCDNTKLRFYMNMLDTNSDSTSAYLYRNFMSKTDRTERLLAAGVYAILHEKNIIASHYLFNSIIGKYSRFDKRKEDIDAEIDERLKVILSKI